MSNAQGKPMTIVCAVALALVVPSSAAYMGAAARTMQQESWNTFSADVTIRRGLRDAAHQPIGNDGPPTTYRWERARSAGRWKSTMRVLGGTRPDVVTLTGQLQAIPPVVARIEDDGDGGGPRFYSPQGILLKAPTESDRRRLGVPDSLPVHSNALTGGSEAALTSGPRVPEHGQEWIDTVLPSPANRSGRRSALVRRFGRAAGKMRGLDRYVETLGASTTEVLTHPDLALPLEINIVRDGVLESHATFVYDAGPGGALVRRSAHAEHTLRAGSGERMVLDVELANVTLEDRR